jgi:hypothetical protein
MTPCRLTPRCRRARLCVSELEFALPQLFAEADFAAMGRELWRLGCGLRNSGTGDLVGGIILIYGKSCSSMTEKHDIAFLSCH